MDFKKRKLNVKFEDKAYTLNFPNLKQIKDHQKKQSKIKGDSLGVIDLSQDFLDELGLPKAVSDEMEADNITDIVQVLSGQKKA